MKLISLTQGKVAKVDDADFEMLSHFKWSAWQNRKNGKFYAARKNAEGHNIYMHRVILECLPSEEGDHRNGDSLDNQRSNLRRSTRSQNAHNRGKNKNNTSGFKGVWALPSGRFQTAIWIKSKKISLGTFDTAALAAQAHTEAANKYLGEFAWQPYSTCA